MRLFPNDKDLGWTPYAWLVYLLYVPLHGLVLPRSTAFWVLTGTGMAVFLGLYVWGHWLEGRGVLGISAAMTALGLATYPGNAGASVYFIYAAAMLGNSRETALAFRLLPVLPVLLGAEAWAFRMPVYAWAPSLVFTVLIGAVTIHLRQRRLDNRRLHLAQEEVAHLAKVAERERIARDLHDVLGHTLSVIVLKSELASKLSERDPDRAAREIRDVERISREALAQVRATVRGYQAQSLKAEAARVASILEAAGLAVDCSFADLALPPGHESILALALREAVTNVIRHARAATCSLRLRTVPGGCELEVRDDGCGEAGPEGAGLAGMRHRVEALGGSLLREAADGTRLVITLPLEATS